MERLSVTGEHIVEDVPAQLLYPVLDHPVRNEDAPHGVGVMVGDTEEAGAITCCDLKPVIFISLYLNITFIVVGNIYTVLEIETGHDVMIILWKSCKMTPLLSRGMINCKDCVKLLRLTRCSPSTLKPVITSLAYSDKYKQRDSHVQLQAGIEIKFAC